MDVKETSNLGRLSRKLNSEPRLQQSRSIPLHQWASINQRLVSNYYMQDSQIVLLTFNTYFRCNIPVILKLTVHNTRF